MSLSAVDFILYSAVKLKFATLLTVYDHYDEPNMALKQWDNKGQEDGKSHVAKFRSTKVFRVLLNCNQIITDTLL